MNITKLGHGCLLVEEQGVRILTDPGAWTTAQNTVKDLDAILITQEHTDHLDITSLVTIISNNPSAVILTNNGVGDILNEDNIPYELLEDGQQKTIKEVNIEGFGEKHADIYHTIMPIVNTGYFIANRFFYPGDALTIPNRPVEILALPVSGPWVKISESIDYALAVNPKICFPVHDGMLKITGPYYGLPEQILNENNIKFVPLKDGEKLEQ